MDRAADILARPARRRASIRALTGCLGRVRGAGAQEGHMAKKSDNGEGVYRIVDVVGVSAVSWEDAGRQAVKTASKSLRDLRIAESSRWT
jgi:flavin-binding protein dodecin